MLPVTIQNKIKNLAEEPGIYLMKGPQGDILYVGKAKNLRNRVSSYFQEGRELTARIQLLVSKIADFDIVITDNEVEALVLECNLIKKYKPYFNVLLKDDKSYPYVRLDVNHPFPRLELTRKVRKDGSRYFGPYVSSYELKDLLRWAQKAFKLRDCSDVEFRNRSRPCILYQMGQCSAPCVGYISDKAYGQAVDHVLKLLDGKTEAVMGELTQQMQDAAAREDFERAAEFRDRISHLEGLAASQKITDPESEKNQDVLHYARQGVQAVVVIMAVRQGRTVGVFQFPFNDLDPDMKDPEFLLQFLAQYYIARQGEEGQVLPEVVLVPDVLEPTKFQEQYRILERALSRRVGFHVPQRGQAAALMNMVLKTAEHHLSEFLEDQERLDRNLQDVQDRLGLKRFPHRMECYDISHFQGDGTVASRVVFVDGKPEKTLYRHYHVRDVTGPDDFKSLYEVLNRRMMAAGEGDALPDLMVIDGGKGQLAQAEAIFQEFRLTGVELAALAKARTTRNFTAKEVTSTLERVFKPGQKNPVLLKPGTGAYKILTQIRDESHRFAITFHRKVRDKKALKKRR